eukprot:CAMPEP_0194085620 /NCGR_PEP_ID=MMETSP0149-20130528/18145_1 /TAXON_ID=122233 /ORGANISM="Chaetoceros debilis, Strain MM31A-1" /LENGTH=601 /DNA_ID=CAMNT_0038768551 /DNA_START=30 /DNA_END=1832 /DNA_ORIENTATION=-
MGIDTTANRRTSEKAASRQMKFVLFVCLLAIAVIMLEHRSLRSAIYVAAVYDDDIDALGFRNGDDGGAKVVDSNSNENGNGNGNDEEGDGNGEEKKPNDNSSNNADGDALQARQKTEKGDANNNEKGSSYITMYGEHRVQPAIKQLPKWLRDYFVWHQAQVANYNTNGNSHSTKYLALTCISNERCGGFSDRLRALPFFLLAAAKVDRILCIYWTNPFGLEHLLQPPKGGMDWRCPPEFDAIVDKSKPSSMQKNFTYYEFYDRNSRRNGSNDIAIAETVLRDIRGNNATFVSMGTVDQDFNKINSLNNIFNAHSYQDRYSAASKWFHVDLSEHIHRVLFEPIPVIGRMINGTMTRLGLVENEYTSVHVRARYPTRHLKGILGENYNNHDSGHYTPSFEGKFKDYLLSLASNAIKCGVFADRDSSDGNDNHNGDKGHNDSRPIYFSSDSSDLSSYIASSYIANNGLLSDKNEKLNDRAMMYHPVSIKDRGTIKHLVGGDRDHAGYYPIIEDLFIMGGSRCVSHGIGSFGAFGAGLAGNRCRAVHRDWRANSIDCPNMNQLHWLANVTDDALLFGEKVSGDNVTANERVPPAKGYFYSETNEW